MFGRAKHRPFLSDINHTHVSRRALRFTQASCLEPLLFLCFLEYLDTTFPTPPSTGSLFCSQLLVQTTGHLVASDFLQNLGQVVEQGGPEDWEGFKLEEGCRIEFASSPVWKEHQKASLKDKGISFLVILPLLRVLARMAQQCPTLCDPIDCSMLGFLVHHQLPKLTQNHVH